MLKFKMFLDWIINGEKKGAFMHIQRIVLLIISVLLIVVGLFVTLISNYPNPGQNLTEPILALFGLITGVLAIVGNKKNLIGLWSKIIVTVVGVIVLLVGIVLPDLAKESVSKSSSTNASSSSDALTDIFNAASNAARTITNTQPEATNAILLVIVLGISFIVSAWVFNFIKNPEVVK